MRKDSSNEAHSRDKQLFKLVLTQFLFFSLAVALKTAAHKLVQASRTRGDRTDLIKVCGILFLICLWSY